MYKRQAQYYLVTLPPQYYTTHLVLDPIFVDIRAAMAVVYESTSLSVALGSTAVVFVWRVVTFRYVLRYERSNIVFEYRVLVDTEYCAALNTSSIQVHTDYQVHGLASHTEYSR